MKRYRKAWRVLLATLIVLGLLSVGGMAIAQSSQNFDLGCWGGLVSANGRIQVSNSILYNASIGQTAAGEATSGQFKLRAGYLQDWRTLDSQNGAPAAQPAHLNADGNVFLPIVQNFVRIVRPCTYN